ncbi:MAG: CRTAC1 family protein [Terriglobia bacterium]
MKRRDFLIQGLIASGLYSAHLGAAPEKEQAGRPQNSGLQFIDITSPAGIHFQHTNAATGRKYLVETMGPGCAFFDYDNDGYLDLYFVNGGLLPGFHATSRPGNVLYRNNRDGTFTDVTRQAGVEGYGYGMGVTVGDYNNDGFADLFITCYGSSILYRNNGDGTFTDVTQTAGVNNRKWGTSAAFFDYDKDGFLDLFVANYVDFSLDHNTFCGIQPDRRAYCHPDEFDPAASVLYHNNGDGTFTDVSKQSGIASAKGKGLGVVAADFDGDGYQDLFVANDAFPNFLFMNNRDGTFRETGTLAGVAYNSNGQALSGMGVAAGDYDGDGKLDLVVTNLSFQGYSLYQNEGRGVFGDVAFPSGVGLPSLLRTGWGVGLGDFDNSGNLDIFAVNGHVMDNIAAFSPSITYLEPPLLLENEGGRFIDETRSCGRVLQTPRASRGAAFGDFNNDGHVDILIANCNQAASLLRNDSGDENHWIILKATGRRSNRDAIGTKVRLTANGKTQTREITGGGSYLSSSDYRLHFGLGKAERIERLEVDWPRGGTQVLEGLKVDRMHHLVEP